MALTMKDDSQVLAEAKAIFAQRNPTTSLSVCQKISIVQEALRSHERYAAEIDRLENFKTFPKLDKGDRNYLEKIFKYIE